MDSPLFITIYSYEQDVDWNPDVVHQLTCLMNIVTWSSISNNLSLNIEIGQRIGIRHVMNWSRQVTNCHVNVTFLQEFVCLKTNLRLSFFYCFEKEQGKQWAFDAHMTKSQKSNLKNN